MSFLDDAKKKLDDVVDEHGDKIADGVEKAGDFIDEKTGHKHADKVDQAQEKSATPSRRCRPTASETPGRVMRPITDPLMAAEGPPSARGCVVA